MILLPAVDIRDGRAVRLRQGRFEDETVYADEPLEAARSFVDAGARWLHVVDLDGARKGAPAIRSRCSRFAGAPLRAPSRSTTCSQRAPASTKERAASSGSSA